MRVALPNPIVGKLGEEFDRVFDRLLAPRLFTEPLLPPFPYEAAGTNWIPVMDVVETPAEYIVRLEVPGIHKENLDINLSGNMLRITGHRDAMQETKDEMYLYREREVGRFVRTLKLPLAVDAGNIEAAYQDGILTIRVPKAPAAMAKKILIK